MHDRERDGHPSLARARVWRRIVLAACAAGLAMPASADAHTELRATAPGEGARLTSAPSRVVAQYSEPLARVAETSVAVDGTPLPAGASGRLSPTDAGRLQIPISPPGRFGRFTVAWQVISADGHALEGRLAFTVTPPSLRTTLRRLSDAIAAAVRELRAAAA